MQFKWGINLRGVTLSKVPEVLLNIPDIVSDAIEKSLQHLDGLRFAPDFNEGGREKIVQTIKDCLQQSKRGQ